MHNETPADILVSFDERSATTRVAPGATAQIAGLPRPAAHVWVHAPLGRWHNATTPHTRLLARTEIATGGSYSIASSDDGKSVECVPCDTI